MMMQQLHQRGRRGKPLLSLRPLSLSLLLSLAFVFHSVNSLDKPFNKESALGQTRDERTQELEIGKDEPFDEPRLSLIEKHLKTKSAQKLHKLSSQYPGDIHQISECPSLKTLTAPSGFIRFPMLADEYENNLHCSWLIVAPPGMVIRLEVEWTDFADYDHCPTCCPDWLGLYDGRSESAPLMTKLCGETEEGAPPATFTTTSSEALLVFVSDENEGDDGFKLNYEIIPKHNAPSDPECGIPYFKPKVDSRIVGGVEATPHSWPWQVNIKYRWSHFCGGSVFNSRWVITAAHCFFDEEPASNFKIVLGEHNITKIEGTEQEFKVKKLIVHEDFNSTTNDNDIALIRLSKDVVFNHYVKPICLPDDGDVLKDGTLCVATGWGETEGTGDEHVLNQVYVPVINKIKCNQTDWYGGNVTNNMICAGYDNGGKDTCRGDSGGPLASFSVTEGKWKLFGLTSWGYDCALPKRPGLYTRVTNYLKWIREKTEQYE